MQVPKAAPAFRPKSRLVLPIIRVWNPILHTKPFLPRNSPLSWLPTWGHPEHPNLTKSSCSICQITKASFSLTIYHRVRFLKKSEASGRGCFEIPLKQTPGVHASTACSIGRNRNRETISTDMNGFFPEENSGSIHIYLKVNALCFQCLSDWHRRSQM